MMPALKYPALARIAVESRTVEEYARRADAWASSESKPPPHRVLVSMWLDHGRDGRATGRRLTAQRARLMDALAVAQQNRINANERMWRTLVNGGNELPDGYKIRRPRVAVGQGSRTFSLVFDGYIIARDSHDDAESRLIAFAHRHNNNNGED